MSLKNSSLLNLKNSALGRIASQELIFISLGGWSVHLKIP